MIHIRPATMEDYEAICLLFRQVDGLHAAWYPEYFRMPEGPNRSQAYIHNWIKKAHTEIFLAFDESGLVGALMIVLERPPGFPIDQPDQVHAAIDNLVVEEQVRGKGIGRRLMKEAGIWAKERGASELRLQVYQKNTAAKRFYEKLGFEPVIEVLRRGI